MLGFLNLTVLIGLNMSVSQVLSDPMGPLFINEGELQAFEKSLNPELALELKAQAKDSLTDLATSHQSPAMTVMQCERRIAQLQVLQYQAMQLIQFLGKLTPTEYLHWFNHQYHQAKRKLRSDKATPHSTHTFSEVTLQSTSSNPKPTLARARRKPSQR